MSGGMGGMQDDEVIEELLDRVANIEAALERLDKLEDKIASIKAANSPGAQDFNVVVKQLKKVSTQVEGLLKGIKNTPGYNARSTFTCPCGSEGTVASVYRCTKCGKDKWLGWWP